MDKKFLTNLRTKKLGVLLCDARATLQKSQEECATAMGVSLQQYQEYEAGIQAPSLPQVEALAYSLKIPVEHFWSTQPLSQSLPPEQTGKPLDTTAFHSLRKRIIATHLRMDRTKADLSIADLAAKAGVDEEVLQKYENGELDIPLSVLESIANALQMKINDLFDQKGPVGLWRNRQIAFSQFEQFSPEVQQFIAKPVNRPYIELAMRLSDLPADKLRTIAESLLQITF